MQPFRIARDFVWRLPLMIVGLTESRAFVTLGDDAVDIQFGFTKISIHYADIRDVNERDWSWLLGLGVRVAGDKTLGLVGSTRGVVQIALRAPTVRGVLFMRAPRNIAVSLEEPASFIAAVRERIEARTAG